MNIKQFIEKLFFSKKSESKNYQTPQQTSPISSSTTPRPRREPTPKKRSFDTTQLRQQVSETEYISNLRIGRSWILPQMVQMGFKRGKFDVNQFEKAIKSKYNGDASGRRMVWELLKRNYKVNADSNNTAPRSKWWTNKLLVQMIIWDFKLIGKRRSGFDRKECKNIRFSITTDYTPKENYATILKYDQCRMRRRSTACDVPEIFIDAFMADGAYNAMMTMVKVLNIRISKGNRGSLSRDESIREIEQKSAVLSGRELLEYCKVTFFDSGVFDYKKYVN